MSDSRPGAIRPARGALRRTCYEVAVVGGGPAGSAAAITLARTGIAVAFVEGPDPAGWRIGETLPPLARPLLERLGAWERFVESGHLVSYGNRSAWGSEELADDDFIFDPHGPGWHLDRGSFDALLRERAADAGATRWRQARLTGALRRRHGGWVLTVQGPEGAATIDASGVIDATGRTSLVARWQGQQRRYDDHLVGVVARLEAPGDRAWSDTTSLIEAVADGWWYSARVPGQRMVVAYMSDADIVAAGKLHRAASWGAALREAPHTSNRVASSGYRLETGPGVVAANSSYLTEAAGDGWVAVGDAAAAHDPLSSRGIVSALATGIDGAGALRAFCMGDARALLEYRLHLDRIHSAFLQNRRAYYQQERRWSGPFWRRRWFPLPTAHARARASSHRRPKGRLVVE